MQYSFTARPPQCRHRASRLHAGRTGTPPTAARQAAFRHRPHTERRKWRTTAAAEGSGGTAPGRTEPVKAVLFDMDGVLCASEHLSRRSACQVFKQLHGLILQEEEFIPFGGMGEDRFLGGVAEKYQVQGFDPQAAKQLFFDIYINTYAQPGVSEIAYAEAVQLVRACKQAGLKTAVASSAERVKVDANLLAAGFSPQDFDAVVSADGFKAIKPAPDIFLRAAELVGTPPRECVVLEDAPAGIKAARAAGMRVVGLTTTLSDKEMRQEGPDLVFPEISYLKVADILGTHYTKAPLNC